MRANLLRLLVPVALLTASLALFEYTELDLLVQDHFFDPATGRWWLDKQATLPRLFFYTGPKAVLIAFGVSLILGLIFQRLRPGRFELPWPTRNVWAVLLSLALVPSTIGLMKARSDIYFPSELTRYGGSKPYHHVFEPLPPGWPPNNGHGFPAGHASGGFALMSLFYLFSERRHRWAGLALGQACGWTMGNYQMFKGAHFLSHTLVTMLIAWLIIELLALLLRVTPPTGPNSSQQGGTARREDEDELNL